MPPSKGIKPLGVSHSQGTVSDSDSQTERLMPPAELQLQLSNIPSPEIPSPSESVGNAVLYVHLNCWLLASSKLLCFTSGVPPN